MQFQCNPSDIDRFWSHVRKSVHPDGCWLTTFALMSNGYGQISVVSNGKHRTITTHRFSWVLHFGSVPDGLHVLHHCDSRYPSRDITYRRCIRPSHLWLGTQADNMRDKAMKGRATSPALTGERHGRAILTEQAAREIRTLYATGEMTYRHLAIRFGVGETTVSHVVHGDTWTT